MITVRYVLFNRIPLYQDEARKLYADDLWARDLLRHLEYIEDFHICCPVLPASEAPKGVVLLPGLETDVLFPLQRERGWFSVFRCLIPNFRQVASATKAGGIMHSGGAGWPFPLSYYLLVLRAFRRFRWVILIESTFWMLPKGQRGPLHKRLAECIHRHLIMRCLRKADARIFTQDWYRETLFGGTDNTLVAPASWIEESIILKAPKKKRDPGPLRVLFPTRMTKEKGVDTVLEAIDSYAGLSGAPDLILDIVGQGDLSDTVDSIVEKHSGRIHLKRLPMKPYGAPFFEMLRGYDAVLVANRTEEQPRLIFDAFSQGVPCFFSATNGNASIAQNALTGLAFEPGDSSALANLLAETAKNPGILTSMGAAALEVAHQHTHEKMHRTRLNFLTKVFGPRR